MGERADPKAPDRSDERDEECERVGPKTSVIPAVSTGTDQPMADMKLELEDELFVLV